MKKVASLFLLLAGLAGVSFGQTALTQTTLSVAQSENPISPYVTLAACSGVLAPTLPGTPVSVIYVGGEAEGILTWNSTTCSGSVFRGYLGTKAMGHPSGDNVIMDLTYQTNLAQGGNPTPSGFYDRDPGLNKACTASATATSPYLNVLTGNQWLCSTVTGSWVPGFQNPLYPAFAEATASVASVAGATLPSGPLFTITGTNAVTGWTIPVGFNATASGGGCFTVIGGSGPATWTAAGNIAVAGTFTANKAFTFCWNAATSKFYPSAVS